MSYYIEPASTSPDQRSQERYAGRKVWTTRWPSLQALSSVCSRQRSVGFCRGVGRYYLVSFYPSILTYFLVCLGIFESII